MLRLTGSPNFRHLPLVREHTLFRSDHLGALDEDDARRIEALGITRVLDFRGVNEREDAVCRLPGVAVHSLAIEPTIVQKLNELLAAGATITAQDVVALMQDTYRGFVTGSTHRFAQFFEHLLASNEPTVFHCTAGKDRTGFAAALVLHALGATPEAIMRDYMRTNELHDPAWLTTTKLPQHVAMVLVRVQPDFLQAAYEAVDAEFGSLEGYLRDGLSLREAERARLRELYMAPA